MDNITKIPRLREARYAACLKTCLDLKPSRISVDREPIAKMNRASSLTQIDRYQPLSPDQYKVKYKSYPQKFCKKSCVICSMRKPTSKNKGLKLGDSMSMDMKSICTQTIPPTPPPERWNAQTQTQKLEAAVNKNSPEKKMPPKRSRWFSIRSVLFTLSIVLCIVAAFSFRHWDLFKRMTNKQPNQPDTGLVNRLLSYIRHSDKNSNDVEERSLACGITPGSIVLSICFSLILAIESFY